MHLEVHYANDYGVHLIAFLLVYNLRHRQPEIFTAMSSAIRYGGQRSCLRISVWKKYTVRRACALPGNFCVSPLCGSLEYCL